VNGSTFHTDTSPADAQAMTMAALQVIAGGWPVIYMRQPAIQGAQAVLDQDAMIRDAVKLAIQVQEKALAALPLSPWTNTERV
jgi:predicted thioesterase